MEKIPLLICICWPALLCGCSAETDTYLQNCRTPLKGWMTKETGRGHLLPTGPVFRLGNDGNLKLRGEAISKADLKKLMDQASAISPAPIAVLEVEADAPCKQVEDVRRIMVEAPMCKGEFPNCAEGWGAKHWKEVGGP